MVELRDIGLKVRPQDAFAVVNLAYTLNKRKWLPLALFICCTGGSAALRNGVAREDGKIERLTDEDFEHCFDAIPRLTEAARKIIEEAYDSKRARTFRDCVHKDGRCQTRVTKLLQEAMNWYQGLTLALQLDPSLFYHHGYRSDGLCLNCHGWLSDCHAERGESAFHRLHS